MTGNSAGLRTVLSSCLSHRELRSSLRESHGFLSLSCPTPRWHHLKAHPFLAIHSADVTSHDIFLSKCHFLLHILRFLFSFSDNIMADVASKQQATALLLSTTVTCTRRHTELTDLMGNLCCAREHSVQFFVQFITHSNCTI